MVVAVCPKCGADLEALIYTTYPPIHAYRCRNCGWTQEERENITRVPIATVERKPITHADRIRAMTDEELAEFIAYSTSCETCVVRKNGSDECHDTNCSKAWLDYLKQEETDV